MVEGQEQYPEHWATWTAFTKGVVRGCIGVAVIVALTAILIAG